MMTALRRWWRHDRPAPAPRPDDAFTDEVRRIRAEMLPRKREIERELAGRGECPLVHDVFPDIPRRRRQEP